MTISAKGGRVRGKIVDVRNSVKVLTLTANNPMEGALLLRLHNACMVLNELELSTMLFKAENLMQRHLKPEPAYDELAAMYAADSEE